MTDTLQQISERLEQIEEELTQRRQVAKAIADRLAFRRRHAADADTIGRAFRALNRRRRPSSDNSE